MRNRFPRRLVVGFAVGGTWGMGHGAVAQTVGYRSQILRLEGQNQVVQSDESRSGGLYLHHAAATPELGAGAATPPFERHGQFVIASLGRVFLKTIAEEAGGGLDPAS